ncbi:MAG: hypothetical protein OXH47_07380 [Paracoccaceae bacterium]|nr:hypothetical protein [Paracoccaceae bacterium]
MAENNKKHTSSRKKSHANPSGLLPELTISNNGPDTDLLQHTLEIVTQGHQVEFTMALGQTPHQEMVKVDPTRISRN